MTNIKDVDLKMNILSDYTIGNTVPIVATSLGAQVIENHLNLDKSIGGLDADFSLVFEEISSLVNTVIDAEKALGLVTYELFEKVEKDIKTGDQFREENIRSVKTGFGFINPKSLKLLIDKIANRDTEFRHPIEIINK